MGDEQEEWRAVPGQPSYQVSAWGRVKGLRGLVGGSLDHGGYLRISLNNGRTKASIHALVMLAFVGERPRSFHIDHINGVKTDNRFVNLRYVSQSINEHNKHVHGTSNRGERSPTNKLTRDQVTSIRAAYIPRRVGAPVLARQYGVSEAAIMQIVKRKIWVWL